MSSNPIDWLGAAPAKNTYVTTVDPIDYSLLITPKGQEADLAHQKLREDQRLHFVCASLMNPDRLFEVL